MTSPGSGQSRSGLPRAGHSRAGQPRIGRVTVTSPQTEFAMARGGRARPPAPPGRPTEPNPPGPPIDTALLRRVLAAQRRAAAVSLAAFLGFLAPLPVILHWIAPAGPRVAGMPVVWLVLGAGIYPALLGLAVQHVRQVEEVEETIVAVYSGREPDQE